MYDRLFTLENVGDIPEGESYRDYLNPDSVRHHKNAKLEQSLADAVPSERYQFVRNGYFIKDNHSGDVFNNIVNLRDTWAKISK